MATSQTIEVAWPHRLLYLYVEPVLALFGALLCRLNPTRFLSTMSPDAIYAPSNQVIYDQVAATYTLFAFNEAVVLRCTTDLRVWRAIILGIVICDAIHLYASWAALGSQVFFSPTLWRWEDWVNLGSLWGQAALRVAFLLGIGVRERQTVIGKTR